MFDSSCSMWADGDAIMKEYHDRFFFIAAYTSGGAPYGITWDEELEFAHSV